MGALNLPFLIAGVSIAVPLFLHLFHRQRTRRLSFPALRYLERTEREHARQIRFRQLLLMALRIAVLVVVVAAGARLFVRGRGSAHPPTAVAVVVDNSVSSGRVVDDQRVLDHLKERAAATLRRATPDDRFWLLRVGEPWRPALPLTAAEALQELDGVDVSAAGGDLDAALSRARGLVATSERDVREVHLLSDLQASAFRGSPAETPGNDVSLVVWREPPPARVNRGLVEVSVGGGLPPLLGQRTEVGVRSAGAATDPDSATELPVRLLVDERIRGAATVPAGASVAIPLPPAPSGWARGWVETDPDDLAADDRRYFAFQARPSPVVLVRGDAGRFAADAAAVLQEAGRVARGVGRPDLIVAASGEGLEGWPEGTAVLVVPPSDPSLLPGLNRRLSGAGIPWRYEAGTDAGRATLLGPRLPEVLQDQDASRWFRLAATADRNASGGALAIAGDDPWLVEGTLVDGGRRYLLLASALDPSWTSLPTSSSMVRFLDWAAGEWAAPGGGRSDAVAGQPLGAPSGATVVERPSGERVPVDGTRSIRDTGEAGFYSFFAGDSLLAVAAVNPPAFESDLTPIAPAALQERMGGTVHEADSPGEWDRAVFRQRQGPELWRGLLALAVLLLGLESVLAAAGRQEAAVRATPPPEAHAV